MVLLKSKAETNDTEYEKNLHSTMVLLKSHLKIFHIPIYYNLHSTMVLLKLFVSWGECSCLFASTFHYGSIKILLVMK